MTVYVWNLSATAVVSIPVIMTYSICDTDVYTGFPVYLYSTEAIISSCTKAAQLCTTEIQTKCHLASLYSFFPNMWLYCLDTSQYTKVFFSIVLILSVLHVLQINIAAEKINRPHPFFLKSACLQV